MGIGFTGAPPQVDGYSTGLNAEGQIQTDKTQFHALNELRLTVLEAESLVDNDSDNFSEKFTDADGLFDSVDTTNSTSLYSTASNKYTNSIIDENTYTYGSTMSKSYTILDELVKRVNFQVQSNLNVSNTKYIISVGFTYTDNTSANSSSYELTTTSTTSLSFDNPNPTKTVKTVTIQGYSTPLTTTINLSNILMSGAKYVVFFEDNNESTKTTSNTNIGAIFWRGLYPSDNFKVRSTRILAKALNANNGRIRGVFTYSDASVAYSDIQDLHNTGYEEFIFFNPNPEKTVTQCGLFVATDTGVENTYTSKDFSLGGGSFDADLILNYDKAKPTDIFLAIYSGNASEIELIGEDTTFELKNSSTGETTGELDAYDVFAVSFTDTPDQLIIHQKETSYSEISKLVFMISDQ